MSAVNDDSYTDMSNEDFDVYLRGMCIHEWLHRLSRHTSAPSRAISFLKDIVHHDLPWMEQNLEQSLPANRSYNMSFQVATVGDAIRSLLYDLDTEKLREQEESIQEIDSRLSRQYQVGPRATAAQLSIVAKLGKVPTKYLMSSFWRGRDESEQQALATAAGPAWGSTRRADDGSMVSEENPRVDFRDWQVLASAYKEATACSGPPVLSAVDPVRLFLLAMVQRRGD